MLSRWTALSLCLCLAPLPALAHPHVWTDYWIEAIADPSGITELRLTWRFDTMFSTMVRNDLKVTTLTPDAIKKIRDKAFSNLKSFNYYTYVTTDGVAWRPDTVKDFTARTHGEQLEYSFTIPLPKAAQSVEVSLYDEELYVDIGPPMKDDGAKSSLMAAVEPEAQQYVSATGRNGAAQPVCVQRQGKTMNNPMWGDFKTFVASCQVAAKP